jgi:CHAT domain-containing protein
MTDIRAARSAAPTATGVGGSPRLIVRCALLVLFLAAALHAQTTSPSAPLSPEFPGRANEAAATKLLESGNAREALVELDRAAQRYRAAGDELGLARVALRRSQAHRLLGRLAEAAADAEDARMRGQADRALLLQAVTQVARIATDQSDFVRAEAAARQAVAIAEQLGDALSHARALRTLGILEDRMGRQHEAIAHLMQAVNAADRAGDAMTRVLVRGSAAASLLSLSRYDAALETAQQGYDIAEQARLPAARASALFDLAQATAHVWNLERAADLWDATVDAQRDIGNHLMVALASKQSVETSFALGEFDRAAADGANAIALLESTGQRQYVAETMARVALSHLRRGARAAARAWADRARAALAAAPESRHLFIHNDLGIVEAELGAPARARADYARVLEVAQRIGNIEYEWRAHWGFGRTALRDRPADAVVPLERAIASVERLRQTIPEAGLRAAFMTNRVGPYETLVEAHMAEATSASDDRVRRAFAVAERARSRALADLLAEARARTVDPQIAAVRDQEAAFGRRFSEIQKRVAAATAAAARDAALAELQNVEREYDAFVLRIRRDNPAYAALAHPRALDADDLSAMLAPDEALIEFLLTDTQGFAWVIRRDQIRGYRIPGRQALDRQVRLLTALLAGRDNDAIERLTAQLHGTLLGPAAALLHGARRLVIVPDGALQRLPFALLRSTDGWLVNTHTIAVAPSATVLHYLRQRPPTRADQPLLAFAAPQTQPGQAAIFDGTGDLLALTHAMEEVHHARRVIGAGAASTRAGAAATERALKAADAGRYRVLHFATHAIADEVVPRRSAILLTPDEHDDGLLQVSEIANLSLDADLVVLAACQSHVGRLLRGEGLLGLSRAFIHAGARAVVATAWAVPDRETAWLMRRFYDALRAGAPADEALRRAQLDAIARGGTLAAPGVWGAFVALGETRTPILDAPAAPRRLVAVLGGVTGGLLAIGLIVTTLSRRRSQAAPL